MTINTMIKLINGNILVALLPTRSHTYITLTYITVTVCKLFKLEGNDEVADFNTCHSWLHFETDTGWCVIHKSVQTDFFKKEINY